VRLEIGFLRSGRIRAVLIYSLLAALIYFMMNKVEYIFVLDSKL